ncbi:M48 family metallopeptidase [Rhodoferax sp.]|uniref:M48 family metallopeptidase n=1 Tax=Rhodoferax sp. TaxID=50421 RepID=UPI00374D10A2
MQLRQVRDIAYQLLPGAQRQTTDIVIERDGLITVRPPLRMTPEQVDTTVLSKRMWIYRNLAEWRSLNATRVVREWVNGESFPYLGSNYRLLLVPEQDTPLQLKDGRFQLLRSVIAAGDTEAGHKAFENFYREKGQARFTDRVAHLAPKVGVAPGAVFVKDIGYRWASCLKNGDLHFHWKCLMAPPTVIDYIVVHELCHIYHRDHSAAFWNEVDKVLPDFRERKEWLRVRGAELDL